MEDHYDGSTSNAVDFIQDILGLIQFSNQRSFHNIIAAITANKSGMREKELARLNVPPKNSPNVEIFGVYRESILGILPKVFFG